MNMTRQLLVKAVIGISIVVTVLSLLSCVLAPYEGVSSDWFENPVIVRNLRNVEQLQAESNWYQSQGENSYGGYLNLFLVLSIFLGSLASIFSGASIWRERTRGKAIACFAIAILVALASAGGLYVKAENERFYEENRHQYAMLSHEINGLIREFYMDFDEGGYDDETIVYLKQEFLALAAHTFEDIDDVKTEYFNKYGLVINPPLEDN